MREIKFRAWNPYKKEMFNTMPIVDFKLMEINAIVLQQYIGLEDKDGKEIYEGDIISVNGFNQVVEYKIKGCDTYGHGDCSFQINAGFSFGSYGTYADAEIEVIGNIYENPELLNK